MLRQAQHDVRSSAKPNLLWQGVLKEPALLGADEQGLRRFEYHAFGLARAGEVDALGRSFQDVGPGVAFEDE